MSDYLNTDYIHFFRAQRERGSSVYNDMMVEYMDALAVRRNEFLLEEYPPAAFLEAAPKIRAALRAELGVDKLGPVPDKPRAEVRSEIHAPGGSRAISAMTIRNLVLLPREKWFVTATLYIPDKLSGKAPALLSVHGHDGIGGPGRRLHLVQAQNVEFAQSGFVVLAVDAVGMGERKSQCHAEGSYLPAAGICTQGIEVWDNMAAVSYLCSLKEVDPKRIAVTGSSGGGGQTMWISAMDERIACGMPTASVSTYQARIARAVGCGACEVIPNAMKHADCWGILGLVAPRWLLINHPTWDPMFPVAAARYTYGKLKAIYAEADVPERIGMAEELREHSYDRALRENARRFACNALGVDFHPTTAPGLSYNEDSAVISSAGAELPATESQHDVFARMIAAAESKRKPMSAGRLVPKLKELLGAPEVPQYSMRSEGEDTLGDATAERIVFRADSGLILTCLRMSKSGAKDSRAPALLYIDSLGKSRACYDRDVRALVDKGVVVYAFDWRGQGDTRWEYDYEEWRILNGSKVLGLPIIGQRAADVAAMLRFVKSEGRAKVSVLARASAGLVLACAYAVADKLPRIDTAVLNGLPASYSLMAGQSLRVYEQQIFASGMGVLADIPDYVGLIDAAKTIVVNPIDGAGKVLGEADARKLFGERVGVFVAENCAGTQFYATLPPTLSFF